MIKKTIAVLLTVLALVTLSAAAYTAGEETDVSLDGSMLDTTAQVNGQTVYLPVRAVCEALGYEVIWRDNGGIQAADISKAGDTITLGLTCQEISDNGHVYAAGVYSGDGIMIISGRMYADSGLFSSIFPVRSSYDLKDNCVTVRRRCENSVTVVTERLSSQKEHLKTTIQYPQLSGLTDNNVQKIINDLLKQSAQNALNQGEKNAAEMAQAIRDGFTGAIGMCETFFDYMVQYNQNGLFSVVLTNYQYAGGAHGSTVQRSLTFDLLTGKPLRLGDLMIRDSGFTKYINDMIRKQIDQKAAAGELYEFEFSRFEDVGENPEFYLSHHAVVFYFQEYAHFPYAAGIQEFSVRFSDLSGMLKKTM